MRLLLLGGTRFLGRHLAEQALAAGHTLTLLHRGHSGAGLFPQARHLITDRNTDLSPLATGHWDSVIDTNAYVPRHVKSVAAALAGRDGHRVGAYLLVSTISVYRDLGPAGPAVTESAPIQTLADPATETVDGNTYGGLKALCEAAAQQAFGSTCLVARPGLLVGPHDPTERFTWWVRRARLGGRMVAPAPALAPLQCIDARDAAAWLLRQAEQGASGCFNLTGPQQAITMGGFIKSLCTTLAPAATPVWMDEDFLLAQGVAPWTGLPLWLPHDSAALHRMNIDRALASGLSCRPLAETLRDTAAWADITPVPASVSTGLAAAREAGLLAAWAAHKRPV